MSRVICPRNIAIRGWEGKSFAFVCEGKCSISSASRLINWRDYGNTGNRYLTRIHFKPWNLARPKKTPSILLQVEGFCFT